MRPRRARSSAKPSDASCTSREPTALTRVDIAADLNSEDESGFVWTFLDEADDLSLIRPRQLVVAGSGSTSAVCEVIEFVQMPVGTVVHLRVLPGTIEQYRRLLSRVGD